MQRRERGQSFCADKARPPRAPAWHTQLCHWGRAAHRCDLFTEVNAFLPPLPTALRKTVFIIFIFGGLPSSLWVLRPRRQGPCVRTGTWFQPLGTQGRVDPRALCGVCSAQTLRVAPSLLCRCFPLRCPCSSCPCISRGQKQGNCCPHSPQFTS